MPSLDPTDVFPPRNLPGDAERWGREVEGVATLLKGSAKNLRQSIESMNRSTAASLQSLGDQIAELSAVRALLLTTESKSDSNLTYSIPSGVTSVATTVSFTVPAGYTKASIFASHSASAQNGVVGVDYLGVLVSIGGVANLGVFGQAGTSSSTNYTNSSSSYTRTVPVTEGDILVVDGLVSSDNGYLSSRRSTLSAMATFYNEP